MSAIFQGYDLWAGYHAAGIVIGEMTQMQSRKELKIRPRALKCRMVLDCSRENLENHTRRGRKIRMV